MGTIVGQEALDAINSLIHDRILARVSWWRSNYPQHANPQWFSDLGYPSVGTVQPGHDSVVGPIDASDMNDLVSYFSGLHAHIRKVRIIIYYNNNGSLQTLSDQTAVGIMNSYFGYNLILPEQMSQGLSIDYSDGNSPGAGGKSFIGYLNAQFNNWAANAGNPVTQTLTNTVCHTNCHSNCHSNRGRR